MAKLPVQAAGEGRKSTAISFLYAVQLIASIQNILHEALPFTPPAKQLIWLGFTDIFSKITILALDEVPTVSLGNTQAQPAHILPLFMLMPCQGPGSTWKKEEERESKHHSAITISDSDGNSVIQYHASKLVAEEGRKVDANLL